MGSDVDVTLISAYIADTPDSMHEQTCASTACIPRPLHLGSTTSGNSLPKFLDPTLLIGCGGLLN